MSAFVFSRTRSSQRASGHVVNLRSPALLGPRTLPAVVDSSDRIAIKDIPTPFNMEKSGPPMMRHRKITIERLEKFVSETYFKDVNIRGKVFPVSSADSVSLSVYHAPGRISFQGFYYYNRK